LSDSHVITSGSNMTSIVENNVSKIVVQLTQNLLWRL